jgi:hypothetical protein
MTFSQDKLAIVIRRETIELKSSYNRRHCIKPVQSQEVNVTPVLVCYETFPIIIDFFTVGIGLRSAVFSSEIGLLFLSLIKT